MSGLEPIAIALAGPMGKLAWGGIKKCWRRYCKHKAKLDDDTSGPVEMEFEQQANAIGEMYDRYANKLGAKFIQGDYKAKRDLTIINNYGDFRIVRNDLSRMVNQTTSAEARIQSFSEDLNKASYRVLQTLQDLAARIDSTLDIGPVSLASGDRDHLAGNGANAPIQEIVSRLSGMLDRKIPLTVTEGDTKYCHGAMALQKVSSRTIEDVAIDGKSRMQYTYVCKFCFLQISNYRRSAKGWGPYEWATLAKSHIIACTTWLDARALFRCIDCDKLGEEHVTIDAEEFILHTQTHVQNATSGKIARDSAYFRESIHIGNFPRQVSHQETMAELEKEIAAYERVVELELAEDPAVRNAKDAAEPLLEPDEDDNDIEAWYHTFLESEVGMEPSPTPKSTVQPQSSSEPVIKLSVPDKQRSTVPLGPETSGMLTHAVPFRPSVQTAPTEAARHPNLGINVPSTPISLPSELSGTTRPIEAPVRQDNRSERVQKVSQNLPATNKAPGTKSVVSSGPAPQRQADALLPVSPRSVAVAEVSDGLSECPGCGQRMKEEAVYGHLDTCPSNIPNKADLAPQYTRLDTQQPGREPVRQAPPEYTIPRKLQQQTSGVNVAPLRPAKGSIDPVFSNNNPYQTSNRIFSTAPTQTQPAIPQRTPPEPPQNQAPRPTNIRQVSPAEYEENYEAQRHPGQTTRRPHTPSRRRESREQHVRQVSSPTASGYRTPQPPGGFPDQHFPEQRMQPTYEQWQSRQ